MVVYVTKTLCYYVVLIFSCDIKHVQEIITFVIITISYVKRTQTCVRPVRVLI